MTTSPEIDDTAAARGSGRRHLQIREVIRETADAVTVVFETPDHDFVYTPGQFVTLGVPAADGLTPRCYSLSSAPGHDTHPAITVKRVAGGLVSNWLVDHAEPGMRLDIIAPTGGFTPREWTDDFVLCAAGSGITPAMSIIKTALGSHSNSVTLLYANRDQESVIFADAIAELERDFADRFTVAHWLESERGLPSSAEFASLVADHGGDRTAYVCGPAPFMDVAQQTLEDAGLPPTRIHREVFYSLTANPFAEAVVSSPQVVGADSDTQVTVEIEGDTHEIAWPEGVVLLDALLDNGIDAPYVCREGNCGGCEFILTAGEVAMRENDTLDEYDLERGARLACQATPVSDTITISYD